MGERFQYYVRLKPKGADEEIIVAIHDQWCWGKASVKYATHLIRMLEETDWKNMVIMNNEIEIYIKAILTVRWNSEDQQHFYHGVCIEDMGYNPISADSNHGCVIIDLRNGTKASFYDTVGIFVPVLDWLKKDERDFPEDDFELELFDGLNQDDYFDLCGEMEKRYKEQVTKEKEKECWNQTECSTHKLADCPKKKGLDYSQSQNVFAEIDKKAEKIANAVVKSTLKHFKAQPKATGKTKAKATKR